MAEISGGRICRHCWTGLNPSFPKRGSDRFQIAPSCSLLHVPIDLDQEAGLDPELKAGWLSPFKKCSNWPRSAPPWRAAGMRSRTLSLRPLRLRRPAKHLPRCMTPRWPVEWRRQSRDWANASAPSRLAPKYSIGFQPAAISDHDHRLVSADRRRQKRARRARQGRAHRRGLRGLSCKTRRRASFAGRKISGSTCWCMANSSATTWCSILASSSPASPSPAWLGSVVWIALRPAADIIRRRVPPAADDGRMVGICAIADRASR